MATLRSAKRRNCPLVVILLSAHAPTAAAMAPPVAMIITNVLGIEPMDGGGCKFLTLLAKIIPASRTAATQRLDF